MKYKLVNENFQSDYVNNLLLSRGVEDLERFINISLDDIYDPQKLDNVGNGINLLQDSKDKNIMIVVDCDVDGFTSGAITYQYLKKANIGKQIDFILHKGKQHGLQDVIDQIINSEVSYGLIVLPDSSSNDYEYHEMLKEIGAKVLVLDHHIIDEDTKISDNAVIINNQTSKNYPNKELTGAGVAWQFFRFADHCYGTNFANELIDLAALGIVGDMGSVLELENHAIISYGFANIKNYMFQTLCEKQKFSMKNVVTPTSVAFYIVPLMNAMIRVGDMDAKERLFISLIDGHRMVECHKLGVPKGTMEEVAIESTRECVNAKAKQNRILENAIGQLELKIEKEDLLSNRILFVELEEEDFPSEINGLLAMRLAAKYKKPTIVARLNEDGYDKGSLRGLNQSELTDFKAFLLESELFEFVQGHPNAAGLSIKNSRIPKLFEYSNEKLADVDFGEEYYDINFERNSTDSDLMFLIKNLYEHDSYWGQRNPQPLILVKDIEVNRFNFQVRGKKKKDTAIITLNGLEFIMFRADDFINEIESYLDEKKKCYVSLIGVASCNTFMGRTTPQFTIRDYEIKSFPFSF